MNRNMMTASLLLVGALACVPLAALDIATATGADLVKENASKEQGFSSAQKKELMQQMNGRTLTFENGKLISASKSFMGDDVSVMVSFAMPGKFYPTLTVNGTISDAESKKIALALDDGSEIKSLTGKVDGDGILGFELTDVKLVPAVMPSFDKGYDPATVTGADLVKLNASKDQGFSSAQKKQIAQDLAGRTLTFENGKLFSASKSFMGDDVTVMVSFAMPGKLYPTLTVSGTISDAESKKIVLALDDGSEIKSLTGKVDANGIMGIELTDAKVVPAVMPSFDKGYDPATVTGADLVKLNAAKDQGLSSAQKKEIMADLAGRTLTFENGKLFSASESFMGDGVSVMVSFAMPGKLYPTLTVSGTISDAESKKIVLALDDGSEIKSLTGKVDGDGIMGIELTDVKIVPAVMPSFDKGYDPATVTGADLVKLNAAKEQGFSSAQKKEIMRDLAGRKLTFENGTIVSVSKSAFDGGMNMMVSFAEPGKRYPSLTVYAGISDPAMKELALKLDDGSAIRSLTGTVDADGVLGFELKDAVIVP